MLFEKLLTNELNASTVICAALEYHARQTYGSLSGFAMRMILSLRISCYSRVFPV
jgi:hypothetical protein